MNSRCRFALFFSFLFSMSLNAQSPGNAYTIGQGDWLSKIAKIAYGNAHLYYKIIEGTNEKALNDQSYSPIPSPNSISVGQKIWIPINVPVTDKGRGGEDVQLVSMPKTNCEIRVWYNYQVVAIGEINKKWIEDGIDIKTRARKAFELRHSARTNARFFMQNKNEVAALQKRDREKYGNPDGPTFEYLMKKSTDKGLSEEAAFQQIIDSASRTSPVYNNECQ